VLIDIYVTNIFINLGSNLYKKLSATKDMRLMDFDFTPMNISNINQPLIAEFMLEVNARMTHNMIGLEYDGVNNKVILFNCHWFDIVNGVKVDYRHGLIEIKHTFTFQSDEPFVLAF
jgi:Domain of unknown function (DUF4216)